MLLLLQAAPLLVLVSLLVSGRATPVAAVLVALALLLPAVLLSLPSGTDVPAFLLDQTLRGVFLAMMPIGVEQQAARHHADRHHGQEDAAQRLVEQEGRDIGA